VLLVDRRSGREAHYTRHPNVDPLDQGIDRIGINTIVQCIPLMCGSLTEAVRRRARYERYTGRLLT